MDESSKRIGVFHFSHKTWWHHVRGVFGRPLELLGAITAIFGTLWTVGEASIQLLEFNPRGWYSYLALFASSLFGAIAWQVYRYVNLCPPGLEGTSRKARRIAHLQRPKWEFALAKALLAERVAPIDRECGDLLDGNVFVLATKPRDFMDYFRWLQSRTDNLSRMLEAAKFLLLHQLPSSMQSSAESHALPDRILAAVDAVARFYRETVEFERSSHAIIPPDDFVKLHRLQLGWAEPIRGGVLQMFRFLHRMCELDPDKEETVQFTIEFKEPPNVDEYCAELGRLESRLPEILDDW
ncbi:MAG: hypothetical protein HQ592_14465 [Planctomycetes bacterium]|nr:hypothetical protein [Planctomycetota bacterium]